MLQFECSKCGHLMDLWSSASRTLVDTEKEKVASGDMKASTQGGRTRQINHDLYIAANFANVGPTALHTFLDGVGCPHGKENRSYATATKLVSSQHTMD